MQKSYSEGRVNILIACDANKSRPWFRDRIPSIEKSASELEWNIEIVDFYNLLGNHKLKPTNIDDREKFLQSANILEVNKYFKEFVFKKNPNVLLLGTVDNYKDFLLARTISQIRENGILVSGILGDDEFNHLQNRFFIGWFDSFVAYVKSMVQYYENLNLSKGYYFPNSCYLGDKTFSNFSQDAQFDAILIGAPIANRPAMITDLINAGLKIAIYGSNDWMKYRHLKENYFGFVRTEDFDKTMMSAKIVLSFLEDNFDGSLHMNTKIWEAVRVARLPITTMYMPLINDYGLTQEENIVLYQSNQELIDLTVFYSNHDEERINIARNLYEKVQKEFDYCVLYKDLFINLMKDAKNLPEINERILQEHDNLTEKLNSLGVFYFKSNVSEIDPQIINIVKTVKQSLSVKLIIVNRIENGRGIRQVWPFISLDSVFSLIPVAGKMGLLFALFRGDIVHVKQFLVISKKRSLVGLLNILIYRVFGTKFGLALKSKLR